jgi:hypothetical protein
LAVWLSVQLAALALAAGRVPLAARYPAAGERLALDLVLVTQVAVSSLLFPWILRDRTATTFSIALCWPVLALALALSGLPPSHLLGAAGYATLWLAALAAWRVALRSQKAQLVGVSIATAWAVGGPLLWYLRAEFNSGPSELNAPGAWYGPVAGALRQAAPGGADAGPATAFWMVAAGVFVIGVTVAAVKQVRFGPRRHARARAASVA